MKLDGKMIEESGQQANSLEVNLIDKAQLIEYQNSCGSSTNSAIPKYILSVMDFADKIDLIKQIGLNQQKGAIRGEFVLLNLLNTAIVSIFSGFKAIFFVFCKRRGRRATVFLYSVSTVFGSSQISARSFRLFKTSKRLEY